MSFALFFHGQQISKAHAAREAAVMEAFERGAVERGSQDFPDDPASFRGLALGEGYDIRAVDGNITRLK